MTVWSWPDSVITREVDGDSIDTILTKDVGFGGTLLHRVRIRLNRINTPPGSTPQGAAATAFVAAALPATGTYLIETVKPYKFGGPPDTPGEWMAEVTLPNGENLSDSLVSAGLAVYWNGEGPRPGGLA